jgi:hypothetical protein
VQQLEVQSTVSSIGIGKQRKGNNMRRETREKIEGGERRYAAGNTRHQKSRTDSTKKGKEKKHKPVGDGRKEA